MLCRVGSDPTAAQPKTNLSLSYVPWPTVHNAITFVLCKFLDAFAKLRKATTTFVISHSLSVRPSAWNNSATIRRIFVKFDI